MDTQIAAILAMDGITSGAIYVLIQTPGGDASALRLAVVSAAIAIVALVISEALQRGLGRRA